MQHFRTNCCILESSGSDCSIAVTEKYVQTGVGREKQGGSYVEINGKGWRISAGRR